MAKVKKDISNGEVESNLYTPAFSLHGGERWNLPITDVH